MLEAYCCEQTRDSGSKNAEFLVLDLRHEDFVRLLLLQVLDAIKPRSHGVGDVGKTQPATDHAFLSPQLLRLPCELSVHEGVEASIRNVRGCHPNKLGRPLRLPVDVSFSMRVFANVRSANLVMGCVERCHIAVAVSDRKLTVDIIIVRYIDVMSTAMLYLKRALKRDRASRCAFSGGERYERGREGQGQQPVSHYLELNAHMKKSHRQQHHRYTMAFIHRLDDFSRPPPTTANNTAGLNASLRAGGNCHTSADDRDQGPDTGDLPGISKYGHVTVLGSAASPPLPPTMSRYPSWNLVVPES